MTKNYYVIDISDDFVLYKGTIQQCEEVVEQNYGGLQVCLYKDLTKKMRLQLQKEKNNDNVKNVTTTN